MNIKRISFQLIKVIVSSGLVIFLLSRKSPGELAPYIRELNPLFLFLAVAVFFTSSLLGAFQWFVLLRAADVILPFGKTFRLYFTGLFFNNFLPANIGGDALKIFDVVRTGYDPHKVFAVTLLDRVFGITGLCLLALAASVVLYDVDPTAQNWLYILIFLSCIVPVLLLAMNRKISRAVRSILGRIGLWGMGERIDRVLTHLGSLRNLRSMSARLILLTLLIQSLRIVTHICVGRSLGLEIGGSAGIYFFVFVPLLGLIMTLPVSINGLGVREGAGVVLFMQIGIGEELAVLMEFITYVVQLAVSLLGGIFFITRNKDSAR